MGIKEIVALGMMFVSGMAVKYGPQQLPHELRKLQIQIMKEVGTTSNWGNPDIFQYRGKKHKKDVRHHE